MGRVAFTGMSQTSEDEEKCCEDQWTVPVICGCPVRGLAYASRPVWRRGKGPKPPGFLPALSGSRRTDRRLERPPPSGHAGPASTSDALGGDLNPPEMRGRGVRSWEWGVCMLCRACGGLLYGNLAGPSSNPAHMYRERSPQTRPAPRGGNLIRRKSHRFR